jgi:hypothetical protein
MTMRLRCGKDGWPLDRRVHEWGRWFGDHDRGATLVDVLVLFVAWVVLATDKKNQGERFHPQG